MSDVITKVESALLDRDRRGVLVGVLAGVVDRDRRGVLVGVLAGVVVRGRRGVPGVLVRDFCVVFLEGDCGGLLSFTYSTCVTGKPVSGSRRTLCVSRNWS